MKVIRTPMRYAEELNVASKSNISLTLLSLLLPFNIQSISALTSMYSSNMLFFYYIFVFY